MWEHVRLVLVIVALMSRAQVARSQKPLLGGAINVFSRYGYLTISMRVVPRNDSDSWIFREPMIDVFHNVFPVSQRQQSKATVFNGEFHMEFCDNVRQLLQAYFRDFLFQQLDRPWKAFTASWSRNVIAKHMGINSSFISGDHCYVLVRLARIRDSQKLIGPTESLILEEAIANEANNISIGDTVSVLNFIKNFGSHYISSFVTGNSLYQVFVYTPHAYHSIKEKLKAQGVANLTNLELRRFFSPGYAVHMGAIQSASGNRSVEAWATKNLGDQYYTLTYASLLKLHGNSNLLRQLDSLLENEALLKLQLRTFLPDFDDPKLRDWFLEVIDNYFKLWEVNM